VKTLGKDFDWKRRQQIQLGLYGEKGRERARENRHGIKLINREKTVANRRKVKELKAKEEREFCFRFASECAKYTLKRKSQREELAPGKEFKDSKREQRVK